MVRSRRSEDRSASTGGCQHAANRTGASRVAARRPRGLCRRRAHRRRDPSSGVPDRGRNRRGDLRHEGRPGEPRRHELRGGRRAPFDLLPAGEDARRPAAAHGGPPPYRRPDLRHVRPFARPRRLLRHRHGDEARCPGRALRPPREPARLLQIRARQRRLHGLRRGAAAGGAQSGVLSSPEHPGADPAGRRRGRPRRHHLGMKMLATGAVYANDIWIGNVIPLAPDQKKEAITCVIPCNAPGLALWSRKPMAADAKSEFDSPLAFRYDESDSMLLCENVHVPWEKVFVHDDALLSRDIYVKSASHCFGNHQSNVRYWSKMRLLLGLCSRVANATGADQVPAVRETLGKMAAIEATIGGLVHGQINAFEPWPDGYACFNRRIMYAGLEWCTQNYSMFIDELRTLCGGGVFQMPADISVVEDDKLAAQFATYWQTPQGDAVTRMKLFRLAWDMVGSEFAGRHLQYEKFYAGASFIIRNHSFRETDWVAFNKLVDVLMAGYDVPTKVTGKAAAE